MQTLQPHVPYVRLVLTVPVPLLPHVLVVPVRKLLRPPVPPTLALAVSKTKWLDKNSILKLDF